MEPKKVLFITQEIAPYVASTPLSELSRSVPAAVAEAGHDIRIFTPCYGTINERRNQLHDVIRLSGINIIVNDADHPLIVKVATMLDGPRLQVYFVDNDEFFKRKSRFKADAKYVNSNMERSVFFVRSVFEAVKTLRWLPDIIHCFGWFSAPALLYLKSMYADDPYFGKAKTIFTAWEGEEKAPLGDNVHDVFSFDNVAEKALHIMDANPTTEGLWQLGYAYADAASLIGGSDATRTLIRPYTDTLKLPLLEEPETTEGTSEVYAPLYEKLFG